MEQQIVYNKEIFLKDFPFNIQDSKNIFYKVYDHGFSNLKQFIIYHSEEHYSMKTIADMIGVSQMTISNWQNALNIKRLPRGGNIKTKWKKYEGIINENRS